MFSADGTPVGPPFQASGIAPVCSNGSCQFQVLRGLTPMDDGGYAVAWMSGFGSGGVTGTFARRFRADGTPGSALGKLDDRDMPGAAMVRNGHPDTFVMIWPATTGSGSNVAERVFDATPLR
jgi:hypothetical protein